jgi:hypothetical protein
MIGRLAQVVDALIAALDDQGTAILAKVDGVTADWVVTPSPVKVKPGELPQPGLLAPSRGPFPKSGKLRFSGHVVIGGAVPNKPNPSSLEVSVHISNQAVNSVFGNTRSTVQADGTWAVSPTLVFVDTMPRPTWLWATVTVENTTAKTMPTKVLVENAVLDWFLETLDREEDWAKKQHAKLSTTPFDPVMFVARARKVIQHGALFDKLLHRARNELALFGPDPERVDGAAGDPELALRWKAAESVMIDGVLVRLSHVLTGIEGGRRQKPDPMPPFGPEVVLEVLTWAGDLGSVVQSYLYERYFPKHYKGAPTFATIKEYLDNLAGEDQLVADIDGYILADRYDPTKSLADNLRAYYGQDSKKRFSVYLKTQTNRGVGLALAREPGTANLTKASRDFIADMTEAVAGLLLLGKLKEASDKPGGPPIPASYPAPVDAMLRKSSPEQQLVINTFIGLIERGLAAGS